MNIRKHWKKFLLTSTALFWANCGGDSDGPIYVASDPNSAASADIQESAATSSSEASIDGNAPASSSSEISSSSYQEPILKLASDTTVSCKKTGRTSGRMGCLLYYTDDKEPSEPSKPDAYELQELLKYNTTRTLEELSAIEDTLETTLVILDGPLYGTPEPLTPSCVRPEMMFSYQCSNNQSYAVHDSVENSFITRDSINHRGEFLQDSKYIYTLEEYFKKYIGDSDNNPESSSSEAESSSSAELPTPLCTKDDFYTNSQVGRAYNDNKKAIIDSVKATLSEDEVEAKNACLDSVSTKEATFIGSVATKQICDGDTIVNPRYQAKLDSNEAFVKKQVDECLGKDE
ncbi:MAG: hypothetical protein J6W54_04285 [Fibrobacter sp.]|uniref:hypothetical protein n=1 Tax=Fibrobacter sp. TaxID=35828 RepID=UPI001B1FF7AE|nr:hypothetical protein [Fibrobacter sp.]MBO7060299.1 hypothetical protein [Fibrobacter sp.]